QRLQSRQLPHTFFIIPDELGLRKSFNFFPLFRIFLHFFNGFNHVNCRIHFSSFPIELGLRKSFNFYPLFRSFS
ncbi:Uncharacterized protein APZ42_003730, partial [Daphnia magna]